MRVLKDVNLNVVSAEVDTIGRNAMDRFNVTYHGEPLTGECGVYSGCGGTVWIVCGGCCVCGRVGGALEAACRGEPLAGGWVR